MRDLCRLHPRRRKRRPRKRDVGSSSVRKVRTLKESQPVKVGPRASSAGDFVSVKDSDECLSRRKAFPGTASTQKE